MLWFSLLVLIPLAAVVVTAADGGWAGFWHTITNEQTAAAIRLTVGTGASSSPSSTWSWARSSPGCSCATSFFGKRALEVLIDIPFALPTIVAGLVLLSLYGPDSPLGVDIANTRPAVFLAFLFVTLPVRGAHGAAGAGRARPRRRGGGRLARRQPVHHLPADHPAEPGARPSPPAPRCRSPAASASTARSCCSRATCRSRPRSPRCASSAASRTTTSPGAAAVATILLVDLARS